jgi:hypothetical protein
MGRLRLNRDRVPDARLPPSRPEIIRRLLRQDARNEPAETEMNRLYNQAASLTAACGSACAATILNVAIHNRWLQWVNFRRQMMSWDGSFPRNRTPTTPIDDMRHVVAAIDDRPRHSGGGCTLSKQTQRPAAVAGPMGQEPTFTAAAKKPEKVLHWQFRDQFPDMWRLPNARPTIRMCEKRHSGDCSDTYLRSRQENQIFIDGGQFLIIHTSDGAPRHLFAE